MQNILELSSGTLFIILSIKCFIYKVYLQIFFSPINCFKDSCYLLSYIKEHKKEGKEKRNPKAFLHHYPFIKALTSVCYPYIFMWDPLQKVLAILN